MIEAAILIEWRKKSATVNTKYDECVSLAACLQQQEKEININFHNNINAFCALLMTFFMTLIRCI